MIIDCHNHVLAAGAYPGYKRFIQEMCLGYFRSMGKLPVDHHPEEKDWEGLEYLWEPIDPETFIRDHDVVGISLSTILAVAPSEYTRYQVRGTIDLAGVTGIAGPPTIEKGNDYIAALVKKYPHKFVGMAAVNPRFRGPDRAAAELERAIVELGLAGLKLYPMYDHYSPDDRALAFPIYAKAAELNIPVMVHQSSTPVIDAPLYLGRPALLDDVGRTFTHLRLLICHAGVPWVEECIVLVAKQPNFYLDVSFFNSTATREEMYRFLIKCKQYGLPWSKVCWGTDYPGFEFPETLLPKFVTINDEAKRLGGPSIPDEDMARMLAGNYARFIGLQGYSLERTLDLMGEWRERWRERYYQAYPETGPGPGHL